MPPADTSWFSPNWQLALIFAAFILFAAFVGGLFALLRQQMNTIEIKLAGTVTPLWEHVLAELTAILRHPHGWALEADALLVELLDEVSEWPQNKMDAARFDRLLVLLAERAQSTNSQLRENERDAAAMYLLALKFARSEAQRKVKLTGIRLIGSIALEAQSAGDAVEREAR